MPFVAFDVLAATAPHATRKPAAHTDREGQTQFSDMLDKPDTTDQAAPKDQGKSQNLDQSASSQVSPQQACDSIDPVPAKTSPDATTAEALPVDTDVAADKPATEQEIADFLAAVAEATGMKITPVVQTKDDAKPVEVKADDQTDDATTTDTAAPAEVKSADAAAIVVTVQADPIPAAPEATVAKSAGIAAAAEQTVTVTAGDTVIPAETKNTKPQAAAKTETPALTSNVAPDAAAPETGKQATDPQAAQPPAAQPQAQAQKPDAPAQAAKPAAASHDTRTPDVASAKPADTTQPMMLLQNNPAAPAADQTALTPAPATAQQAVALPVQGIAVEIAGKALAGKNRFEIRLDPPELGKIHVRLDVDHKGEVTSIITADRSDTFDLLRRDAQALERALQDAGVKTSSNGLQFSLRDHGAGRHDQPALADSARVIVRDDNLDTEITVPVYRPFTGNRAGVDIRV